MEIENVIEIETEVEEVIGIEVDASEAKEGLSAYEVYLKNGGILSETKWLESLKGEPGSNGYNGSDGKSVYEIWLEQGNEGTEEDFLNSLKGDPGEQGIKGENGNDGYTPIKGTDYFTEEDIKSLNIPTKTSELDNDAGFITDYTENDPTVPNHVKNILESDITNWNNILNIDIRNMNFIEPDTELYNKIRDFTYNNTNTAKIILAKQSDYNNDVTMGYIYNNNCYSGLYYNGGGIWEIVLEVNNSGNRFSVSRKWSRILTVDGNQSYNVSSNTTPAHKKYVDDAISAQVGNISTILETLTTVSEVSK